MLAEPPPGSSSSPEADRTESRPVVATGGDIIPAGQRNATFTSLAGTMRRAGSSEQAILEALKVTNQNRSEQPLDERELEQIAEASPATRLSSPTAVSPGGSSRR